MRRFNCEGKVQLKEDNVEDGLDMQRQSAIQWPWLSATV
jgi:hypothetical protein